MRLTNEFTVDAPADRSGVTLLDLDRVAGCLPGARLTAAGPDGRHDGSLLVQVGPVRMAYRGTVLVGEIDEDERVVVVFVDGREQHGTGSAAATITSRVASTPSGGTSIAVETELRLTGRAARFDREVIEDVARAAVDEFAQRLEHEIRTGADRETVSPVTASAVAQSAAALDIRPAPARLLRRYAAVAALAGTAAAIAGAAVTRRRRGGPSIIVGLRP